MKKILPVCLPLLLLTSCLLFAPTAAPPPLPDPLKTDWDDRSIFRDGLEQSHQGVLEKLPGASVYHLELNIGDDMHHMDGAQEVRYINSEDAALNDVRFRLFPNILGGEMKVSDVRINNETVAPAYELNDSLLIIPFKQPLKPGEHAVIRMNFKVTVPQSVDLNYGVQAYHAGVLALAHAYPMIPVYDDEGWNAEIPPQSGDVTYTDMSFFLVKVTAPENVVLAAAGREVQREARDGMQIVTYAAGPVRDFYLAASPEFEILTQKAGNLQLRFYTKDNLTDGAQAALETAKRAIEDYDERYALYPYTELDFVSTPTQALGIEYPGMIAITERILSPDHPYLEGTVAHEVGHQWFYNLVGNDQLDDPWLDESLTQFVTMQYFADEYGASGERAYRESLLSRWAGIGNEPIPVGRPVAEYTDEQYSAIVYGRGGLFFEALRDEMGTDNFDRFMKDYVAVNAWDIAMPEKLKSIAEEDCACSLTPLFQQWVYDVP